MDTFAILQEELDPGERVLWCGQPKQGLMFRPSDALMIPFSLLWGGFAIFWESMAIIEGAPLLFVLWGILFVLVGLYLIVGRFIVDAMRRKRTYYALTSERVIVVSGLLRRSVRTLSLKALSDISVSVNSSGSGTITLGPGPRLIPWYLGFAWPGMERYMPATLEGIDNAKWVYDLIRKAQREG